MAKPRHGGQLQISSNVWTIGLQAGKTLAKCLHTDIMFFGGILKVLNLATYLLALFSRQKH
jgi:hypothetical protein